MFQFGMDTIRYKAKKESPFRWSYADVSRKLPAFAKLLVCVGEEMQRRQVRESGAS